MFEAPQAPTLPILRVVVLGDGPALSEFERHVCETLSWPDWSWQDDDFVRRDSVRMRTRCTPMNRLLIMVASGEAPRSAIAAFDADVLVLATSFQRPTCACGPPNVYGRQVFPNASLVMWLGHKTRGAHEERVLRGALRASGLPCDEAASVWSDLDPQGEHLAQTLDAVYPRRPSEQRSAVRHDPSGKAFHCGLCGARLTRPMRRVKTYPVPQGAGGLLSEGAMFPEGGVFAYGVNADAWGREQIGPGDGPPEVVLFDARDLLWKQIRAVGPWSGGCCGMMPADAMNLACACGHRVGYTWSECEGFRVRVLRLDRVRVGSPQGA